MGSCKFGDNCTLRHDCEPEGGKEAAKKSLICPYFEKGNCRHKDRCYFSHEARTRQQEAEDEPDFIIEPTDVPANAVCNDVIGPTSVVDNGDGETCGICLSAVAQSGKRFALFSGCSHCFCYECARSWHRKQKMFKKAQGVDVEHTLLKHSCPECRTESDCIFPSKYFLTGKAKVEAIDDYKRERASRSCKFFKIGTRGSCPFGPRCFYAHKDIDGTDMKPFDTAKPKGQSLEDSSLQCLLGTPILL